MVKHETVVLVQIVGRFRTSSVDGADMQVIKVMLDMHLVLTFSHLLTKNELHLTNLDHKR